MEEVPDVPVKVSEQDEAQETRRQGMGTQQRQLEAGEPEAVQQRNAGRVR